MSTHAQEMRYELRQKRIPNATMKVFVYLYIETAVQMKLHYTQIPWIHTCLKASFMREFGTNALPAVGNELILPNECEIGRHHRKSGVSAPTVTSVRQVVRNGVLDHEVIYTQRVELTSEEANFSTDHKFCVNHQETHPETKAFATLEANYFHDIIRPLLEKEGFVYRYSHKDTNVPQRN